MRVSAVLLAVAQRKTCRLDLNTQPRKCSKTHFARGFVDFDLDQRPLQVWLSQRRLLFYTCIIVAEKCTSVGNRF